MKCLNLAVVLVLLGCGSICAQSPEEITSITFTRQSRGFVDEVVISRDSARGFMEDHRRPDESKHYARDVDMNDWMKLMEALKGVSLEDIDGLQSPTMDRAHDGALHASIVIAFADGKSVTHSFDNENPHPDLKPLLDAILKFRTPSDR